MEYFFTADTHFNHHNIIKYCKRPFKHVLEMNEELIKRWNEVVGPEDFVYHLGDFGFPGGGTLPVITDIISRLHGKIGLIVGSHDKELKRLLSNGQAPTKTGTFSFLKSIETVILTTGPQENATIVMCHYAMRVWPFSHFGSWHLFGHSHGTLPAWGKSHDVGVDAENFRPVSLSEIKMIMQEKPDNFDLTHQNR